MITGQQQQVFVHYNPIKAMCGNVPQDERGWIPPDTIFPPPHIAQTLDIHTYILAGTNDITTLTRNKKQHYKECIYTENKDDTIAHIIRDMAICEATIRRNHATPIFCTITPMNITKYNHSLLQSNATHTLKHEHEYDNWQTQIDTIIEDINTHQHTHHRN